MTALRPIKPGKIFGRLTVVKELSTRRPFDGKRRQTIRHILAKCVCGKTKRFILANLISRKTRSCGCLWRDIMPMAKTTHGGSYSPEYGVWLGMKRRCKDKKEKHYRGKGITVCNRWMNFANFKKDMGSRPRGYWIDRKDNNKCYKPSNCRWSSIDEQATNRSNVRWITFRGKKKCLKWWSDRLGISHTSLIERLNKWPIDQALTQKKCSR